MLLNYLLIMIFLFLSIAFFTIMERKMLGSFHLRLGPNKVGILGLFQPFSDAIKLFSKNYNFLMKISEVYFNISPLLMFFLLIIIFNIIPMKMENNNIIFNMMIFILLLGMSMFPMIWSSFFSFSKFSIISSKRSIAQMISYEMGLMFIFIFMIIIKNKLNLEELSNFFYLNSYNKIMILSIGYLLILSETSRIPFDFIESESELISGFNIEYSGVYFSVFFIFEYGMMMIFSMILSILFSNMLMIMMMNYFFIIIRSSFPRIRYDQMMIFFWKFIFFFMFSIMMFFKIF